uniref:Collagen, type VI, alpha 3 n=1 Tax=Oncorhynchus mykiss TaxID=8022 RepID=A0A8C7VJH0_ONCMY
HRKRPEAQRRETPQHWGSSPVCQGQCLYCLLRKKQLCSVFPLPMHHLIKKIFSEHSHSLVESQAPRRDVVFLLDGSDGTRSGFPAMRDFVQRVVETLGVDENKDRVAVVQYSRDPAAQFYLNTYTTKGEILNTVRGLRHKGGRPLNTGAALQYVRDNVLTASSGSRSQEGVPQMLILLSGGRSSDNVDIPASALKDSGVLIFGIGTRNSSREVQGIATDPSFSQSVSEFTDLPSVQEQFFSTLITVQVEATPKTPTVTVDQSIARKDVVFLLDGSDGTRNGFPAMRDFVQRVVEKLTVEENRDRVSVVQYSRESEAHFYLNTYTTKEDVVNTVRGLRHKGGRPLNTGAALQDVRDNVFTASSGSRRLEGVPQILILLNGGRSFDNVDTPASDLKELGVLVFGIGTRSSDSRELQKISYDPSYALSVPFMLDLFRTSVGMFSMIALSPMHTLTLSLNVESQAPRRDVVFLLDGSDGTRSGFPAMRDFVQRVVETLGVDENKDRVAVVQYSRDPAAQFYLNTYTTKGEILNTVRGLRHKGGRPLNTGAALQYVRDNVLTASSGSRRTEGVPQLLILLSGGRSFDNVDTPASALKELGVLIFGIGTRSSDSRELQRISHDPSYALSVSDFTDLPNIQQQLLSSVESVTTMTPTAPRRDVVFLLDGSDGTRSGFPAMRDFVQRVVETLGVDENKDRVAVVQYSRDPAAQFYLNTYTTKGEILNTVRGLRHKGGRPLNTGAALQYVRDNVLTASSGSRRTEGVPQLLILLSGGRSFDNVDTPASALKELGVLIFGIGTRSSDSRELQRISHDPSYALSVSDFTDLPNIHKMSAEKDVVFLVDGSDGTRNGFPAMRDFVQRVVGKLNVGGDKDRVSVVQYGRDQEVHFYLNTYTTKEDILNTVRSLRHRGGRPLNTGAALQYVRDNVLTASSGSRSQEGVPQMLILLSGGRSSDNVDIPASALKDSGVLIFGIGTRNSSREVQGIATDPSFSQSVSEFTDLPSVQEQFFSTLITVQVEATPKTPTVTGKNGCDVVFLLDGSDGTRNGFPAMRDFVQRVVEKLTVEENRDRVSVVQYSRESEAHFYLNTYTTKEDVVNTVRGLRHKGGRPLNTGAALQYVRDNVFTASSGSRRLEGVPQILILLNGGRSFDNVDTPASDLKELGVLVFGIGTRSSDSRELQKISYDPSYALSVSEFTDLPNVQQQLLSAMSTVIVQVTTMTPTVKPTILVESQAPRRDVVFLLDGSDGTRSGFPAMRDFVQRVVETLGVDENKDRVAVVQYSRDPAAQFYLNTYTTKGEILNTVRGLRHKGGRPLNTGAALQYVRDNVLTASSGSRRTEGVPQLLILLSGGRSFDNVDTPASALKELGVLIFGIGTRSSDSREFQEGVPQMLILLSGGRSSDNVDIPASALKDSGVLIFGIGTRNSSREVQGIATDPSFSQSVSEFTDLPSVQEHNVNIVSVLFLKLLVDQSIARKDVVFLLDGSDGTRNGFPAMRDFVQRVVEKLTVEENRDRVSVVQYSRESEAHFYLNTYTTNEDVVNTVRGLRHKGGRPLNTGAALQYVRDNVFTASSGSRRLEGVPQILILLNGGRSFDNVDTPASDLKELGVLVFGIGTRSSDSRELQKISYDPSYALSVSEFTDLPNVQQQLLSAMSTVIVQVTTMTPTVKPTILGKINMVLISSIFTLTSGFEYLIQLCPVFPLPMHHLIKHFFSEHSHSLVESQAPRRDVVFLLDGSDGTRSGFPAMRDFVQRVVETLGVDENKDRVAVVQYSRDPAAQFYLNTYTTKGEILNTVQGLRHKGGRPLNTGAALQYVRDNVLTASSGSRRTEGVPQLLILLSGGRSFDNVDTPASALKELGVLIFGIGTRSSDSRELQRISHDPSYALSVSDFTDLPNIQQQLLSSVESVVIDVTPESTTDLGMCHHC